jgi:hypothetical protein
MKDQKTFIIISLLEVTVLRSFLAHLWGLLDESMVCGFFTGGLIAWGTGSTTYNTLLAIFVGVSTTVFLRPSKEDAA